MSKHNYKQYYNNKPTGENENKGVFVTGLTVDNAPADEELSSITTTASTVEVATIEMPEVVEPAPVEPITGKVVDCKKLNIRKAANKLSDVVVVVPVDTTLVIDLENSKPDWYSVCTAAGIEGYCMKKFVKI